MSLIAFLLIASSFSVRIGTVIASLLFIMLLAGKTISTLYTENRLKKLMTGNEIHKVIPYNNQRITVILKPTTTKTFDGDTITIPKKALLISIESAKKIGLIE